MIEKRFNDLYNRAFEKHCNTFSEFLNLDEQSVLEGSYLPCVKFGGYDMAERIVAGFGEDICKEDFPISILKIEPVNQKFADKLTHRDFLGSLINLGIKREMLGDILILDNVGYLFCLEQIKDYIIDSLDRIKHTTVKAGEISSLPEIALVKPEPSEILVSSTRLDVVISGIYKLSRSEASRLFFGGKVFVNSRLCENTSYMLKENDLISVRGFGRFEYLGQVRKTKKDRLVVQVLIYK